MGEERPEIIPDRRFFLVRGTIRVEPGAVPWNLMEHTIERAVDRAYELADGDYNISIIVLPMGDEGETPQSYAAQQTAGQECLWDQ